MTVEYVQTELEFETEPVTTIPDILSPQEAQHLVNSHIAVRYAHPTPQAKCYHVEDASPGEVASKSRAMPTSYLGLIHRVQNSGIAEHEIADSAEIFLPTPEEIVRRVQKAAASEIVALATEIEAQIRNGIRPSHLGRNQSILNKAAETILQNYSAPLPSNPVDIVRKIWLRLREQYSFWELRPNSKHLPLQAGTLYSPTLVQGIWNSPEQEAFETSLLSLLERNPDQSLTDPRFGLEVQRLCVTNIRQPAVQVKGIADTALVHFENAIATRWVVVLDNYLRNSADSTLTGPSVATCLKAIVLGNCFANGNFGHADSIELPPTEVLILERIFDLESRRIGYRLLPVFGREGQQYLAKLEDYLQFFRDNYDQLHILKREVDKVVVDPHLPKSKEEFTRPGQYAMNLA